LPFTEQDKTPSEEDKKLSEEDKKLWDFLIESNNHVINQFDTMIVGIGALFFAYGQSYNLFIIRMLIGMIGFGSSVIMTMLYHNSQEDREHIEEELKGTHLMQRYKRAVSWRDRGLNRYFYFRAARLVKYGSVLLGAMWMMLVIRDLGRIFGFSFNFFVYLWTGVLLAVVLGVLTIIQKIRDMRGNT
jgi:hypothetical protein